MKKTFELSHPKLNLARLIEAYKHEAKKYIKREQRKNLPEGFDFWDFDCKFGMNEAEADTIHAREINKAIDKAESGQWASFYLEIIAKPMQRVVREKSEGSELDGDNSIAE